MIWKRAERVYANGYWVFVLYWNKCSKRKPSYKSNKCYKKRSTACPFQLKFTKHQKEQYRLTDGDFYHNHPLTTPVLDSVILRQLDSFDPTSSKPAIVRKFINQKFHKDITYAQIAYELAKRKKKLTFESYSFTAGDLASQHFTYNKSISCQDKVKGILNTIYFNGDHKWRDFLIIHKIQNSIIFLGFSNNYSMILFAFAVLNHLAEEDYLWTLQNFYNQNFLNKNCIIPSFLLIDYDEGLKKSCEVTFASSKIFISPWSWKRLEKEVSQQQGNLKLDNL